jgi:polar amino acid transport system permease protein
MPAYDWDWSFVGQSVPFLLGGIAMTARVCAAAAVLVVPIALIMATLRQSRWRILRAVAAVYVDVFRTTPFLVQLVWFFFVLPMLTGYQLEAFETAVLALALYIGSYQTDVVRAGILSLEAGQREAGLALGMRPFQAYHRIILPQAMARMIPPTLNVLIILIKESAVTSAVSVTDLMWRAGAVATRSYRFLEPLTFAGVAYLAIIIPLSLAARWIHRRQRAAFD